MKIPSLYMSMASCTTQLDEHMWVEILKRFPVETLVRFRCVCKWWNSLISSSFFASHCLSSDDSNKSYILFESSEDSSSNTFHTPDDQDPHRLSFLRAPFESQPIQDRFLDFKVIDVVHGVVCLSQRGIKSTYLTVLWNPTIHKYVEIPLLPAFDGLVAGFGFDGRKNDFKVVKNLAPGKQQLSFEMFSTQERRWRKVDADHIGPCSLTYTDGGCFKNGVIHWIGRRSNEEVLLMFDCEREEFKTMELPRELKEQDARKVVFPFIACCTGVLSVLAVTVMGDRCFKVAAWVMDEYGVASSWRKLTRDQVDVVDVRDCGVFRLEIDHPSASMWRRIGSIKRSHQPFNDYVFEPSMFLMDGKSLPLSE